MTAFLFALTALHPFNDPGRTGFDLRGSSVPPSLIMPGGPGKDGIPAFINPEFLTREEADSFLEDSNRVIALQIGSVAKAYPIRILNWHEIVNDYFGNLPVTITYCPLCGTGVAFDSRLDGKVYNFGVSGLLYNNDLIFYDYETESLWLQIEMKAITGKHKGKKLKPIPILHTTWGNWKRKHPETVVLAPDIGMKQNYAFNPYREYQASEGLMFPVGKRDARYHPKEMVMGIKINGEAKAFPFSELKKSPESFGSGVGGTPVIVNFDEDTSTASITGMDGKPLNTIVGFWFAWYAFNSDTLVYTAE